LPLNPSSEGFADAYTAAQPEATEPCGPPEAFGLWVSAEQRAAIR